MDNKPDLLHLFASSVGGTALVATLVNPASTLDVENLVPVQELNIGITQKQGPETETILLHRILPPPFQH